MSLDKHEPPGDGPNTRPEGRELTPDEVERLDAELWAQLAALGIPRFNPDARDWLPEPDNLPVPKEFIKKYVRGELPDQLADEVEECIFAFRSYFDAFTQALEDRLFEKK